MKKKLYLPDKIPIIIAFFLLFILEILAFIELIKNCIGFFKCIKGLNIRGIIDKIIIISIYLIAFIFLLYNLLKILRFTIILNKTNIYIYSDFYSKKTKCSTILQFLIKILKALTSYGLILIQSGKKVAMKIFLAEIKIPRI